MEKAAGIESIAKIMSVDSTIKMIRKRVVNFQPSDFLITNFPWCSSVVSGKYFCASRRVRFLERSMCSSFLSFKSLIPV